MITDYTLWMGATTKTRWTSWWNPDDALTMLKLRATPFHYVILKIHMLRGIVSHKVWTSLEGWEQKVVKQFIEWHIKRSPRHTLAIYGGWHYDPIILEDEFDEYRAMGVTKFILDAGSKVDRLEHTAIINSYFQPNITIITEAYGLVDGKIPDVIKQMPAWCNLNYYIKRVHGAWIPNSDDSPHMVMVRSYQPSRFPYIPPVSRDLLLDLQDKGFAVCVSFEAAIKAGLVENPLDVDDDESPSVELQTKEPSNIA